MRVLGYRSPLHVPAVESYALEPFFVVDAAFALVYSCCRAIGSYFFSWAPCFSRDPNFEGACWLLLFISDQHKDTTAVSSMLTEFLKLMHMLKFINGLDEAADN